MGRPASRLRFHKYTIPVILRLILGAGLRPLEGGARTKLLS